MSIRDLFSTAREDSFPGVDYSLGLFEYIYIALTIIFAIDIFVRVTADNGAGYYAKRPKLRSLPDRLRRRAVLLECSCLVFLALVVVGSLALRPFIGGTNLHITLKVLGLLLALAYGLVIRRIEKRMVKKHDETK